MSEIKALHGDSREVLKTLSDNSIDAILTDPPYALVSITKRFSKTSEGDNTQTSERSREKTDPYARTAKGFMGKDWDNGQTAFAEEFWREVYRVLKPGGHMLVFGGTRTFHRLVCAIEDAGFEIRDTVAWVYGSGFPKSHDISKGIDNHLGAKRTVKIGVKVGHENFVGRINHPLNDGWDRPWASDPEAVDRYNSKFAPETDKAKQWDGFGTALKPAYEPICLARKPLIGTIAENVLEHGVGGLNIDGCRVGTSKRVPGSISKGNGENHFALAGSVDGSLRHETGNEGGHNPNIGRWPANFIHDGFDEVISIFPDSKGQQSDVRGTEASDCHNGVHNGPRSRLAYAVRGDSGSAARFFKQCKFEDKEWLSQNLRLSIVDIAEKNLSRRNELVFSALVHAVNLVLPEGLCCKIENYPEHSTSVTVKELKMLCEQSIIAMQTIAPKFLQEWQQKELSQPNSHVKIVAQRQPTGIMTITVSHWRLDSSADPVIFNIMPENMELGEKDLIRFKYCAKASKRDRRDSKHPTVKPINLLRYLARLITPPGGTILDPFAGSGTTGEAAFLEGFHSILIEREVEYFADIQKRIEEVMDETKEAERNELD